MDIKAIEINDEVFPVEDSEARQQIQQLNTTIAEQQNIIEQLQKIGTTQIGISINVGTVRSARFTYSQIGKIVFFEIYLNITLQSSANNLTLIPSGKIPPTRKDSALGTPVFYYTLNYPNTNPKTCKILINKDGSVTMTTDEVNIALTGSGIYFTD